MATEYLSFQPLNINLNPLDTNKQGEVEIATLIDLNDFGTIQWRVEPDANNPNVVFDTGLLDTIPISGWFGDTGWTFGAGAEYTTADLSELIQTDVFQDGQVYEVRVSIQGLQQGFISLFQGVKEEIVFSNNSVFKFYIKGNDVGEIRFVPSALVNVGTKITSVIAYPMPFNYFVGIYDQDEVFVTDATLLTPAKNSVTNRFIWGDLGLPTSCIKVGVIDEFSENIIFDTGINNASEWTIAAAAGLVGVIQESTFQAAADSGTGDVSITHLIPPLIDGVTYIIRYVIRTIGGATSVVTCGTVAGASNVDQGIFEEEITSDGTAFELTITLANVGDEAEVEYIEIYEKGSLALSTPSARNFTQLLNFGDHTAKSIRVNWCNTQDAFGFIYEESDFNQIIRLDAKLVKPSYKIERDKTDTSNGRRIKRFYRQKKVQEFVIGLQPEFIHDALSLIPGHDQFFIENDRFEIEDGDYDPDWEDNTDFIASVVLEVVEVPIFKTKIRSVEQSDADCSLPPSCIQTQDNFIFLVEDESDGSCILLETQF